MDRDRVAIDDDERFVDIRYPIRLVLEEAAIPKGVEVGRGQGTHHVLVDDRRERAVVEGWSLTIGDCVRQLA